MTTRAGTPLHGRPPARTTPLGSARRKRDHFKKNDVDGASLPKLPAVSTNLDLGTDIQPLEPSLVVVVEKLSLNKQNDDKLPLIEEVPRDPENGSPELDPPGVSTAVGNGSGQLVTMSDMVKDGVEVPGVGLIKEGDLLVPVGNTQSQTMYIPSTVNDQPAPPIPDPEPVPSTSKKYDLNAVRQILAGMGVDRALWTTDADVLRFLMQQAAGGVAHSPPSLMGRGRGVPIASAPQPQDLQPPDPNVLDPLIDISVETEEVPPPVMAIATSNIIRPVINADQPARLAPMSAPKPQADGNIEYWRGGGRLGNSSVTPTGVEPIRAQGSDSFTQDIIYGVYNKILGRMERTVVGERSVTIKGVVALPYKQGSAPIARIEVEYPRTYPLARAPVRTKIAWGQPVKNGMVDPAIVQEYLPEHKVDSRRVGSTMRGEANMSNIFAQSTIPLLHQGQESYDLMGMFTLVHLLIDYSIFIDKRGLNRVRGPIHADSVITINILAEGQDAQNAAIATVNAINIGRIPIQRRLLTSADISVLHAISAGIGTITVDAGNQPFIHNRIDWPRVNWVLWDSNPAALPVPAVVTTAQLRATASKLATWCDASSDYVEGYIRAQTIINGKLTHGEDGTDNYMMCMMDVERLSLPFPRGRSFIWEMLTSKYVHIQPQEALKAEFDIVIERTVDEIVLIGSVVASAVSLATSSIFNQFNLSGKNLCSWAAHGPIPVSNFLNGLTSGRSGSQVNTLSLVMCNVLPQFLGFKISKSCFVGGQWCDGFAHRADVNENQLWASTWGNHVPYLLRPEVLEWVMVKWLSVWGISGPNLTYDISNEVYVVGPADSTGLMIWLGDDKYREAALTKVPFTYDPYGVFLLNALRQDWRYAVPWVVSFRKISRSVGESVLIDPAYMVDQDWQPDYDEATFTVVPGTLMTYDWEEGVVLGPNVLRGDMDEGVWMRIGFHQKVTDSAAGYMSDVAPSRAMLNVQGYDFDQLFFGTRTAAAHNVAPTAAENEEN